MNFEKKKTIMYMVEYFDVKVAMHKIHLENAAWNCVANKKLVVSVTKRVQ